jgi:hypothetical protein
MVSTQSVGTASFLTPHEVPVQFISFLRAENSPEADDERSTRVMLILGLSRVKERASPFETVTSSRSMTCLNVYRSSMYDDVEDESARRTTSLKSHRAKLPSKLPEQSASLGILSDPHLYIIAFVPV